MTLYAESSAVLSWLLGESPGDLVRELLSSADTVFTSDLTLLECDRAIRQAETIDRIGAQDAEATRSRLESGSASWHLFRIGEGIVNRARRRFPHEPVRALDALHLATALRVCEFQPDLRVLSFDRRIRSNAIALGIEVEPGAGS